VRRIEQPDAELERQQFASSFRLRRTLAAPSAR